MEKFNKKNLFVGTVIERQNVSRDGVGTALIGAYKTIAYKTKDGKYYDLVLNHEMDRVDPEKSEYGVFYFLEEGLYIQTQKDEELTFEELKQLIIEINELRKKALTNEIKSSVRN